MQLRSIEYFTALARERHFARAPRRVVSHSLHCRRALPLEEQLGKRLIVRERRFAGLTAEGEAMLPWAERLLADHTLGHDAAARAAADHIASFWNPRMKAQIFACLADGGAGLCPTGWAAIELLRNKGDPPSQTRATEFNAVGKSGHADAG